MFYGNFSVRAFLSRQEVQVQTPNHCEGKAIIWRDFLFPPRAQVKRDTLLCTFPVLGAESSSINFLTEGKALQEDLVALCGSEALSLIPNEHQSLNHTTIEMASPKHP